MLIVQIPDDGRGRRRMLRALAYLVPVPLIFAALVIGYGSRWWWLILAVETWWLWAAWTDPRTR